MAFDGLFIYSLLKQLRPLLINSRLAKIYQPFSQDLVLTFRKEHQNHQLLISANAQYPRFYITKEEISNPDKAPVFNMVLRKYLAGAILKNIVQVGLDRIVNFHFQTRNELGDSIKLILSIELMGRHSNVILYNQAHKKIIDLLKRVNPDENRARLLLPQAKYELPPLKPGLNGFEISKKQFKALKTKFSNNPALLVKKMEGLDGDDRKELTGYLKDDYSFFSFRTFFNQFETPKAFVLKNERNRRRIYLYLPYHLDFKLGSSDTNLCRALDAFYAYQANRDWVKQKAVKVERVVKNERSRLIRKIKKLRVQLTKAENSGGYRIHGEILTANLNKIKRGMQNISLPNYYENNKPITIKLDPTLSPARNAQKFFKRYKKLRDSIRHIRQQIKIAKQSLKYFASIQTAVDNAEPQDIDQIQEELINQGYLRQQKKPHRRKKITEHNLNQFKLSSGKIVFVGKNNYQNDWLTLKKANKYDYWFHVKNMPGSHVILRDDQPSSTDIKETAEIAAFFSKGKLSAHVPVDYVQDRRVKKPKGAKPGFVIYRGQKSIQVTPDRQSVLSKRID